MLLGKFLNPKFHLEYFWRVQMLGEQLGKRLCEDLVNFERRLGFFIDQIFGASKSDWIFLKRFDAAWSRNRGPTL